MDTTENKELVLVQSGYIAADNGLAGLMAEELDSMSVTFDRIKVPAGGGLMFELPGDSPDNPETVKEITGVILYHHAINSYYEETFTGGNNPPDCGSLDGKWGQGNPGGECRICPLNQFGSGRNGSGKACKNKRRIYLLREGEVFPMLLTLPTGSLKEFSNYIKRLVAKGKHSYSVVTRIGLKKAVNSNGIPFSQAVFSVQRDLGPQEAEAMRLLSEKLKEATGRIALNYDADTEPADGGFTA